jgi:hypothetical protein
MKKIYQPIIFCVFTYTFCAAQVSGVGINETIPQQTLHLGLSNGTIRVEGLDENNNDYNLGSTNTYQLYVDYQGDMTLYNGTLFNNNGSDAFTDANINEAEAILLNGDEDGLEIIQISSFTITVNRPSLLLIKYNLSFEVFENSDEHDLRDKKARRINTFFRLNGSTRKYCHVSKSYTGGDVEYNVTGMFYNMSSSYMVIPTAGTHTIEVFGEISSGLEADTPNTGLATCVKFGRGDDTLMYKLY